jgi:hypothetical protein
MRDLGSWSWPERHVFFLLLLELLLPLSSTQEPFQSFRNQVVANALIPYTNGGDHHDYKRSSQRHDTANANNDRYRK